MEPIDLTNTPKVRGWDFDRDVDTRAKTQGWLLSEDKKFLLLIFDGRAGRYDLIYCTYCEPIPETRPATASEWEEWAESPEAQRYLVEIEGENGLHSPTYPNYPLETLSGISRVRIDWMRHPDQWERSGLTVEVSE